MVQENPMESDDIGMFELAHDDCLLQELNTFLLCGAICQWLDSHLPLLSPHTPHSPPHHTKLSTAQLTGKSSVERLFNAIAI